LRIAFFSPLRPIASGISDYSEELLPHLAEDAEISLFVDGYEPSNLLIRRQFPIYDYREFETVHQAQPFDINLYHMGNHPCHTHMYPLLQRYPGVMMLHDCVLHHFLGYLFDEEAELQTYLAAFPEEGPSLVRRRQAGLWSELDHFVFPGIRRAVESSRGILVHSKHAQDLVLRAVPSARVAVVRHHWGPQLSPYADLPPEAIKVKLGFHPDTFLVVSPGIVTPARRIPTILRAFNWLVEMVPTSRCVIAGPDHPEVRVQELVHKLNLDGLVEITGFVDVPTFQSYILAADALINLRYPLAGETSGGLIRALGMGKPILISNVGQYAEFPDDCCLKVDLGEAEEDIAVEYLLLLARDPALGRQIGQQAQKYIQTFHAIERSARGYLDFLSAVLEDQPAATPADDLNVRAIMEEIRRGMIKDPL
jgi:glycosyltransferase involved in cell wall biosynthesis